VAVAGALISNAIGAFGRKPTIPKLPEISPDNIQQQAIAGNLNSLPSLQALGSQVNDFNQEQQLKSIQKALEFALPGGLGKAQGIVNSQLAGEIPADVQAQIQRSSAARAISGGYGGGSGLGRNLTLRDLGLTSLQQQQQGFNNFGALAGLMPKAQQFDVTSMFFSPQQRLESAFKERSDQFQRNLLAEQVAAAPDPGTAALGREIDRFFNTAASVGMTAAGGGMG
jgi:hypothetical protein